MRVRVTTRVLRTVDKCGGLDEYLLGEKAGRIKDLGMGGWKLRWRIMKTEKVKERFAREREAAGLPVKEEVLVGSNGNLATKAQVEEEIRAFDEELDRDSGIGIEIGEDAGVMEGGFIEEKQLGNNKVQS